MTDLRPLRLLACRLVLAGLTLALAACAAVPPGAGSDPSDPLEAVNRQVFKFNQVTDALLIKPLAIVYTDITPEPVQDCVSGIFRNLREPSNAVNNLFQGKPRDAASDVCRFAINTTVGLLGCFDPASRMGFERHFEDFGQTLAVWGLPPGPFIVIPLLGPSTVRDGLGLYVETYLDLNFYVRNVPLRNSIFGARLVNQRAGLLGTDKLIENAALDPYLFVRDAYLQRRQSLIFDGNPPRTDDDAPAAPAAPASR